jgi:hypothetical protein
MGLRFPDVSLSLSARTSSVSKGAFSSISRSSYRKCVSSYLNGNLGETHSREKRQLIPQIVTGL